MSATDWNAELRKIEREFDRLPPEPSPADLRARHTAELRARRRKAERNTKASVWARLLLVGALAGAVVFWPYSHECGEGLLVYMASQGTVIAGGLWVAVCTWRCRMAMTHGLAMVMVMWGLALIGAQVLPRVGYAKADPVNPPQWRCWASASHT